LPSRHSPAPTNSCDHNLDLNHPILSFQPTTQIINTASAVHRYQAEAYELYESSDQQANLAAIEDKDVTIIGMSKMIVNM
jgi:hypothetical protein